MRFVDFVIGIGIGAVVAALASSAWTPKARSQEYYVERAWVQVIVTKDDEGFDELRLRIAGQPDRFVRMTPAIKSYLLKRLGGGCI